ncbi:hypothetical protein KBC79_06795 [Candidatus Woesebacteria bacterium]|nr:hypothetical protein [Candidatus Woesebacteria bacterium]
MSYEGQGPNGEKLGEEILSLEAVRESSDRVFAQVGEVTARLAALEQQGMPDEQQHHQLKEELSAERKALIARLRQLNEQELQLAVGGNQVEFVEEEGETERIQQIRELQSYFSDKFMTALRSADIPLIGSEQVLSAFSKAINTFYGQQFHSGKPLPTHAEIDQYIGTVVAEISKQFASDQGQPEAVAI